MVNNNKYVSFIFAKDLVNDIEQSKILDKVSYDPFNHCVIHLWDYMSHNYVNFKQESISLSDLRSRVHNTTLTLPGFIM